jgi:hypothetical protein
MAKDTLPAISEHDAKGEIAELYADIRQTLNVSAINYVWRHIATIDGGLRWASRVGWKGNVNICRHSLATRGCLA